MIKFHKSAAAVGVIVFSLAATASAATLTLSPSSKTLNVGDTLTVQILLDTQGQPVDGVDIQALNYNPYFLQLQGGQVQAGNLMPDTAINSANTTDGKLLFSQITNPGSTYTGSGVLATVTFKAVTAGTAKLTFDYTSGGTTQTVVASRGSNILTSVTNGTFTINNAPGSNSGSGSGGSGSNGNLPTNSYGSQNNSPTTTLSPDKLALLKQLIAQLRALTIQLFKASNTKNRALAFGSKGTDVWALQVYLMLDGLTNGSKLLKVGPTGTFGAMTKLAVIEFQQAMHLPSTGLVGNLTKAALK